MVLSGEKPELPEGLRNAKPGQMCFLHHLTSHGPQKSSLTAYKCTFGTQRSALWHTYACPWGQLSIAPGFSVLGRGFKGHAGQEEG